MKIKDREIGVGFPCYIIAEMSSNHAGSLDRAIEIIQEAKRSGADCIKLQTYTADTMTILSDKEYFKIKAGTWKGENLYTLYKKAQTPWEWQGRLKEEAEKIGLDFFSTPYDRTSVDFLEELGVEFYKISSFELLDVPLIKYVASKKKPIIMSTGMATFGEIEQSVKTIRDCGLEEIALLRCSSAYPAVLEDMNLRTIMHLGNAFGVPVGFSDHSIGSIAAVTAVALGAKIIEKHICLSREIKSPDSLFSAEPLEFKQMVKDIRNVEKAVGEVSYEISELERINKNFRKSIFIVKDIKSGEAFSKENIRVIRPGNGISPQFYQEIMGKKAVLDISSGMPLSWHHVERENNLMKEEHFDI